MGKRREAGSRGVPPCIQAGVAYAAGAGRADCPRPDYVDRPTRRPAGRGRRSESSRTVPAREAIEAGELRQTPARCSPSALYDEAPLPEGFPRVHPGWCDRDQSSTRRTARRSARQFWTRCSTTSRPRDIPMTAPVEMTEVGLERGAVDGAHGLPYTRASEVGAPGGDRRRRGDRHARRDARRLARGCAAELTDQSSPRELPGAPAGDGSRVSRKIIELVRGDTAVPPVRLQQPDGPRIRSEYWEAQVVLEAIRLSRLFR